MSGHTFPKLFSHSAERPRGPRRRRTRSFFPQPEGLESRQLLTTPTVPQGFSVGVVTQGGPLAGLHIDGLVSDHSTGNLYVASEPAANAQTQQTQFSNFDLWQVTPTGTVTHVGNYAISHDEITQLAWGPDGQIYTSDMNGVVYAINPTTGNSSIYSNTGNFVDFYGLQWDANGNLIVMSSQGASDSFYAVTPGSGEVFLGTQNQTDSLEYGDTFGIQPNGDYALYPAGSIGFEFGGSPNLVTQLNTANHIAGDNYPIAHLSSTPLDALAPGGGLGIPVGYSIGAVDPVTGDVYATSANDGPGSTRISYTPGGVGPSATSSIFVDHIGNDILPTAGSTDGPSQGVTALTFGPRTDGSPGNSLFFLDSYSDTIYEVYSGAAASRATPQFSSVTSATVVYGTATTTLSGTITAGNLVPNGFVTMNVGSLYQTANIDPSTGNFSASFPTQTLLVAPSPYTINYSYMSTTKFAAASDSSQNLVVTPAPLTITADSLTKLYGAPLPTLTASYTGLMNGDNSAGLTTQPTLTTTGTASSHVAGNPYTITVGGAVDPNYTISYVGGTLTVTPAALTITADSKTNIYGAGLPTLTASYNGLVNGDSSASLATQPTLTTTATAASHVAGSPYSISASGAVDTDYSISYVAGTLTVTPAALTITANSQTKVYGAALPTLTASYTGFVNGDSSASLATQPKLTTTAKAASHVAGSPYSITASGAVGSTDYTISYVAGNLTVTPAVLTITAGSKSKVYGAALPTLTASYSGFVNGDSSTSLTTKPTLTTTATAASHVAGNPYSITASGAVATSDYSISYVAGNLTVTPAALTITAGSKSKVYGAALPTLTASYNGFVNGDSSASLTTQPALTTTATAASHVAGSPYSTTASGAVDPDYSISYVAGSLTVRSTALRIAADSKSKVYGAALPTLTASYTGFVNGDSSTSLTALPTLTTTATAASHVAGSPYSITASGAVATSDYSVSYVAGKLTVTPAALVISADNQVKPYGAPLPALTASLSGFVNGDTAASLSTQPKLSTTAKASSHVVAGGYAISATGAADPDYTMSYASGNLTVTPAALTISANNQSKLYGAALPTLTASYSGLVNGDTAAGLDTPPTLSTTALASSHVVAGGYAISATGAADTDYTIGYANGTLTVTPVALTISANNQTMIYGASVPTLTASYKGFVNGDTAASLTTPPTLSTPASVASPVGTYAINGTGAGDTDYTIGYVAGKLSVTPAHLTVTADNQVKAYHDPNPPLTATISGFVLGQTLSTSGVTGAAALSTPATGTSHPGTYSITLAKGTLAAANYDFAFVPGTFTIVKANTSFSGTVNQTVVFGSQSVTITGKVLDGALVPTGPVTITLSSSSTTVQLKADGSFSAKVALPNLATGIYTVSYSYGGDANFNGATATSSVTDTYGTTVLNNLNNPQKGGSTFKILLQVNDASGNNDSSQSLAVTALGVAPVSNPTAITPPTGSNPQFAFSGNQYSFQLTLVDGSGNPLSPGSYLFYYSIAGDPVVHSLVFTVN
jgi:hypothetical protein